MSRERKAVADQAEWSATEVVDAESLLQVPPVAQIFQVPVSGAIIHVSPRERLWYMHYYKKKKKQARSRQYRLEPTTSASSRWPQGKHDPLINVKENKDTHGVAGD